MKAARGAAWAPDGTLVDEASAVAANMLTHHLREGRRAAGSQHPATGP